MRRGVPTTPLTDPLGPGDERIVLPLYPQSNDVSATCARLIPRSSHLVWFSYLDGYIAAVADGLSGHVRFCAEDLPDKHDLYRRHVKESASKIAARAGITYDLAFGAEEGMSLTSPLREAWGTHPAFVAALANLVRRALSEED